MFIKCGNEFKKFQGFDKKLANTLEISFDNCEPVRCSVDHKFLKMDHQFIEAKDLKIGDIIKNEKYSISQVADIVDIGKHIVYTPIAVDGEAYEIEQGLINHNCSFIGSSSTLISGAILEKLMESEPVETMFEDLTLNIYEKPIPGALYVMGCDCATGVGGDYACVQVVKINSRTDMEQVATYRSNTVKPGQYARIIDFISTMYNHAMYILENNDVGEKVAEELWYTIENTNLINTEKAGHGLGTKADKRSKLQACMELQRVVDAEILKIHDSTTIAEISRFEERSPNVFAAAKGNHDDTVSALYWAIFATMQPEIDMDNVKVVEIEKESENMTIDMMADSLEYENDFWSDFK